MSESRRHKLELLKESLARRDLATAAELLRAAGRSPVMPGAGGAGPGPDRGPLDLRQACPGVVAPAETPAGKAAYWLIRRTLAEAAPGSERIAQDYSAVLRGARQRFSEDAALGASPALCRAADGEPEDLLFLDAETCPPAETAIFLLGLMSYAGGQFVFEQLLARDCSEEAAILQAFADRYGQAPVLVTFNGRAFNMSLLRQRCALHGILLPRRGPPNLDLRHESRRRWRHDLPDCRLQTLERVLCGRRRVGDIPDSRIPDAYRRFVTGGDARELRDVVRHNVLDLLTMAQLVVAVLTGCGPPVE